MFTAYLRGIETENKDGNRAKAEAFTAYLRGIETYDDDLFRRSPACSQPT